MDKLELKKVYDELLTAECRDCRFVYSCYLLQKNGKDYICDLVIEEISKSIEE